MFASIFHAISSYITPAIILLGFINAYVWIRTRSKIEKLQKSVHSWTHYGFHGEGSTNINELIMLSDNAALWYTGYANVTAIFPLMGIFGTVCSLIGLSPGADTSDNFFNALDTTIWGLIFAMVFKVADSFISSKLDRALDEADYQIHKLTQEVGKSYAQTETGYHH